MNYLEAVVRVYNRWGRRDNMYKARIKILVKAEGQAYVDQVEEEFHQIVEVEGGPHTITQAEYDRVAANFREPDLDLSPADAEAETLALLRTAAEEDKDFGRWLTRNVLPWCVLQFGGMAFLLGLSFLRPAPGAFNFRIGAVIALYALAKVLELADPAVYGFTGQLVAGHALKHIVAALAALPVIAA